MIYITQLIYIKKGEEQAFLEFEAKAIPLLEKYNGKMLLRIRPTDDCFIETNMDEPYEVHFVSFETADDLNAFMNDKSRKQFLHLKRQSIQSSILIKGQVME